ncbi:MAG: glycoside hydrolase family 3 protein [Spirochaetaceae bacterium]|jgi:beta-N-acetylhexosaminidase|nr:glycoside hydrolase family 3 protein [Spirochaetaceae bacterium]
MNRFNVNYSSKFDFFRVLFNAAQPAALAFFCLPLVFLSFDVQNIARPAFFYPGFKYIESYAERDAALEQKARKIAVSLGAGELCGQVIMTGVDAAGAVSNEEAARILRIKPGAIMLFRKNLNISEDSIIKMNASLAVCAALKTEDGLLYPFIACDQEGGAVMRVKSAGASLPEPAYYNRLRAGSGEEAALKAIRRDALASAACLLRLGLSLNMAPVAEPLTAENQRFLGGRSYGGDSNWTAKAALEFMRGMEEGGIACVVKHFPGNTGVDPHRARPVLRWSGVELDALCEPFRAAASSGLPAGIMVSHSIAAAWDSERAASVSPFVIQKKIKEEMNFFGFVLADDFSMGAMGGTLAPDAAIASLAAGADMIMAWPVNLAATYNAINAAFNRGVLKRERLEDAAARIIYMRLRSQALRGASV